MSMMDEDNPLKEQTTNVHVISIRDDVEYDDDYNFWAHAASIVSGATVCSPSDLRRGIKNLQETIGTGYYDGEGDVLMQHIVDHLTKCLPTAERDK